MDELIDKHEFETLNILCVHYFGIELKNSSKDLIKRQLKNIRIISIEEIENHYDELICILSES